MTGTCGATSPGGSLRCLRPLHSGGHIWEHHTARNHDSKEERKNNEQREYEGKR